MFKVCASENLVSAIDKSLFRNSFLSVLNRDTWFGIIPDDLITLIFELANMRSLHDIYIKVPDYINNPISYELKYFTKRHKVMNRSSTATFTLSNLPENKDLEVLRYHTESPPEHEYLNNVFIIKDFDFDIINKIWELNPYNLRKVKEYCDEIESLVPNQYMIDSERLLRRLISCVWVEVWFPPITNIDWDTITDETLQNLINDYFEEVNDEYGAHWFLDCADYMIRHGVPHRKEDLENKRRGLMILYNIHDQASGYHMRTELGQHLLYDREDTECDGDPKEIWIEKTDHSFISKNNGGEYSLRLIEQHHRRIDDYPYHIKKLIANTIAAKKTFKRLLNYMTYKRKCRIMTIDRYLATGIDTTFTYLNKNKKMMEEIRTLKRVSFKHRKIKDSYKYMDEAPNVFDIIQFLPLERKYKEIYKDKNKKDEALYYLMKMSLLCYPDDRYKTYPQTFKIMCQGFIPYERKLSYRWENNIYLSRKDLYYQYQFMGSKQDLYERIHPEYPTSRIDIKLGIQMMKVARSLELDKDIFQDLDTLEKTWRKVMK